VPAIKFIHIGLQCKAGDHTTLHSLPKRSHETDTMSRNQTTDRVLRVAVEDLVLSQKDKPKGHSQIVRFPMKLKFFVQVYTGK